MSDFAYSKDEVIKLAMYSFEPYWPEKAGLKICITDAWPAAPQDAYGLEKLASEEIYMHYGKDFEMESESRGSTTFTGPTAPGREEGRRLPRLSAERF